MMEIHARVLRRSSILWMGIALLVVFNLLAARSHSAVLTDVALAATGGFALFTIGFGIWAARVTKKKKPAEHVTPSR